MMAHFAKPMEEPPSKDSCAVATENRSLYQVLGGLAVSVVNRRRLGRESRLLEHCQLSPPEQQAHVLGPLGVCRALCDSGAASVAVPPMAITPAPRPPVLGALQGQIFALGLVLPLRAQQQLQGGGS